MSIVNRSLFFLFIVFSAPSWGMESELEPSKSSNLTLQMSEPKADKELYLVVGSTRKESYVNPFAKKIFGDTVDFTHQNTFNGKATTLDICPSAILDVPHIQADALSYKPGPNAVIRAIFTELFPSIYLTSQQVSRTKNEKRDPKEVWSEMMLMPETIRNLAQYMTEGATLEIEHLPFTSFYEMGYYVQAVSTLRKYNPFHGFLSPFFMENLEARNHLGIDAKVAFWKTILDAKKSFMPWNDEAAGSGVDEAIKSHPKLLQAIQNIAILLPNEQVEARLNIEFNLYQTNPAQFFSSLFRGSLSEFIASEFTMLSQQDLIKAFLERNGFKDVRVERKDNPYNNRKNVWMISASRNKDSIPKEDR